MDPVYFDYAATTPVDARVLEAMLPFFSERFGNANSLYALGRDGYRALEDARERFASSIGAAKPSEVLFTGAGTESDNAALVGVMSRLAPDGGGHLIVSAYEHHAILEPAHWLEKQGHSVTYLKPRTDGHVHADDLADAMTERTKLVSIMHGNNEIGADQRHRRVGGRGPRGWRAHAHRCRPDPRQGAVRCGRARRRRRIVLGAQDLRSQGRGGALPQARDEVRSAAQGRRPGVQEAQRNAERRRCRGFAVALETDARRAAD